MQKHYQKQKEKRKNLKYKSISSPVGLLKIVVNDQNLLANLWDKERLNRVRLGSMEEDPQDAIILETEKQLNEYFQGQRTSFDLPMEMQGTSFQQEVWECLNNIPHGETWTYKDVALSINRPQAVRAVGSAIGRNPISIIVPCHRVIAISGSLTGFAGGLDRKRYLLELETH